jgi:hypothetical protein
MPTEAPLDGTYYRMPAHYERFKGIYRVIQKLL